MMNSVAMKSMGDRNTIFIGQMELILFIFRKGQNYYMLSYYKKLAEYRMKTSRVILINTIS